MICSVKSIFGTFLPPSPKNRTMSHSLPSIICLLCYLWYWAPIDWSATPTVTMTGKSSNRSSVSQARVCIWSSQILKKLWKSQYLGVRRWIWCYLDLFHRHFSKICYYLVFTFPFKKYLVKFVFVSYFKLDLR